MRVTHRYKGMQLAGLVLKVIGYALTVDKNGVRDTARLVISQVFVVRLGLLAHPHLPQATMTLIYVSLLPVNREPGAPSRSWATKSQLRLAVSHINRCRALSSRQLTTALCRCVRARQSRTRTLPCPSRSSSCGRALARRSARPPVPQSGRIGWDIIAI